jgi:hemolysin III
VAEKFDHCAIYLLIGEPIRLFSGRGNSPLARGLMMVIWSLALLGILFKLTIAHRFKVLSGDLSDDGLAVADCGLSTGDQTGGRGRHAVGGWGRGVFAGVIFYVCKRILYNHAIWHGFVLGGSMSLPGCYLYVGQV